MTQEETRSQVDDKKFATLFLALVHSIVNKAEIDLGISPEPTSQKSEKNLKMAQFNIDLLMELKAKTKNNLLEEEAQQLDNCINELQLKFVKNS